MDNKDIDNSFNRYPHPDNNFEPDSSFKRCPNPNPDDDSTDYSNVLLQIEYKKIKDFTLFVSPKPVQSVRHNFKGFSYQPKRVKDYKNELLAQFKKNCCNKFILDRIDKNSILKALIHFNFPIPKNDKTIESGDYIIKKKGDLDNLIKPLFDVCFNSFLEKKIDDSNVAEVQASKHYNLQPMINFSLYKIILENN